MNTNSAITLNKIDEELLSPRQFINLKPGDKVNIAYTQVIPARLGQRDFGKIKVHYKKPIYK
ncbi:hypothetical protein [Legionella erythra]|uniref:Uncharacterized protein n=1 Tax=Legionella erythra TaxID=448 RepID=A0A0W0TUU6_LEGER|nr:hypothetical protein [Legionella erythra]KTC99523.1 hypothetical protein Lery_0424 [Legionella erythra]